MEVRLARLTAASRGEAQFSGSSSGTDTGSEGEGSEEGGAGGEGAEAQRVVDDLDGPEVLVDPDAPSLEHPERSTAEGAETRRLALVNLDWGQLRAVDIHALLQSVVPAKGGGALLRVTVYPSNYGLARMEEEARHGPTRLFEAAVRASAAAAAAAAARSAGSGSGRRRGTAGMLQPAKTARGGAEEDTPVLDKELVRKYELNKLKYYFAVAEFDSAATAAAAYEAADGLEMEDSANVLDLRFVPDGTTFSTAPRDVSEGVPDDYEACVIWGPTLASLFSSCALASLPYPLVRGATTRPSSTGPRFQRARCSPPTWSSRGRGTTRSARATCPGTS